MFASGAGALVAYFVTLANATVIAEARLQARVGEVPSVPGTQFTTVAMPSLSLNWTSGLDQLQLQFNSRILWRPLDRPHDRPLFLETLVLSHSRRLSRLSQWRSELRASYGEQDYMSLSQTLATQPTLPLATTMLMAEANTGPSWQVTRRTGLACRLSFTHRRSLDSSTGNGGAPGGAYTIPTQFAFGATPSLGHTLSPSSSLSVSVPVSDYDIQGSAGSLFPGRVNTLTIQPRIGLTERLSLVHQLQISAGATYSKILYGTSSGRDSPISPLGQVGLDSSFYRTASLSLISTVSAAIARLVDPVVGSGRMRGTATVGLTARIDQRWTGDLRASFASDISRPPDTGTQDVSMVVSLDSSLGYRWPNLVALDFGARFSERATHPSAPQFVWRGRELWFSLTISASGTASLGAAHPPTNPIGR